MRAIKLQLGDFRLFNEAEIYIGKRLTAIAGNNGTGKSTILGLLANSSELKKRKSLLKKSYRGEFSELFSADPTHDPSGRKILLEYEERGEDLTAVFRTTWQKGDRFRIIPRRKRLNGTPTESKVESPVIYLGLSRLYPIGESKDDAKATSHRWKDHDDEKWFNENYSRILSIHDQIKSMSSLSLSGIASKRGTGVETEAYGPVTNSAGQDNLGQILLAVLSFRNLKDELEGDWDGGLLLIDEIDAALHPAAQQRLIKLLLDESREVGFQVVFTTHSTVVLKMLCEKNQYNPSDAPGDVEVAYLSNANGSLDAVRNPSWATIENGLFVTNPALNSRRVGVFSEDPEARWFMRGILDVLYPDVVNSIDLLNISMGWKEILSLYVGDFSYFRNRVVVLDGDVTEEDIEDRVQPALLRSGANIIRLPGDERPENVIWGYLSKKPEDGSSLWADLNSVGISWSSLVESPPKMLYPNENERNCYKHWLRTYEQLFERAHVVEHWVAENECAAKAFAEEFLKAYNNVAKRTGAAVLPMAKKGPSR